METAFGKGAGVIHAAVNTMALARNWAVGRVGQAGHHRSHQLGAPPLPSRGGDELQAQQAVREGPPPPDGYPHDSPSERWQCHGPPGAKSLRQQGGGRRSRSGAGTAAGSPRVRSRPADTVYPPSCRRCWTRYHSPAGLSIGGSTSGDGRSSAACNAVWHSPHRATRRVEASCRSSAAVSGPSVRSCCCG